MDCSLPGSSVHGIFHARVPEWVAISFFRGSSRPRNWTRVSCIAGRRFTIWATREAKAFVKFYTTLKIIQHAYSGRREVYNMKYFLIRWCDEPSFLAALFGMVAVDSLGQYGDPNLGFAPPCSETTDRGMRKGAVWITSWSVVDAFTHKEPRYFPLISFQNYMALQEYKCDTSC